MLLRKLLKYSRRIAIGTKLLVLVAAALLFTVGGLTINSLNTFNKEALNSTFLSSDLITATKTSEIHSWLSTVLKRAEGIANAGKSFVPSLNEKDLLFVEISESGTVTFRWINGVIGRKVAFSESKLTEIRTLTRPNKSKLEAGFAQTYGITLPSQHRVLWLILPLVGKPGYLSVGVMQDVLTKSFEETAPYTFALYNREGALLTEPGNPFPPKLKDGLNLEIVRKMLMSELPRDSLEFESNGQNYLGTYSKLGIAELSVLGAIPKSTALSRGLSLIKRSFLIAALIVSVFLILVYLFGESIAAPIRKLKRATRQISKGNYEVDVAVRTGDEIADLAIGFNFMSMEISKRVENLTKITEASQKMSTLVDSVEVLEFTSDTLMELLKCKRGIAWYRHSRDAAAEELKTVKRNWFDESQISVRQLSEKIGTSEQIMKIRLETGYALAAPITENAEVVGYVVVTDRFSSSYDFHDEDFSIANSVLASTCNAFDNIQLLGATAEAARVEKERETSQYVQETAFPPASIVRDSIEIQSAYLPAVPCGGDWWGCLEFGTDKLLLAIGNASGMGTSAAMAAATTRSAFSVLHGIGKNSPMLASSPNIILHILNKAVFEAGQGNILMTLFVAVLDLKSGELTYANASHDPAYLYRPTIAGEEGSKENLSPLESELGPRLGQSEKAFYKQSKVQLRSEDRLILYTDGIPEGQDSHSLEYGEGKFVESLLANMHRKPADLRDGVLADFRQYIDKEPLHDDATLVICLVKAFAQS